MEKIYLSDFMNLQDGGNVSAKLSEWQKRYPASSFLNIFYLKLQPNRIAGKNRAKLLLTLPDREFFHELNVEAMPVVDIKRDLQPLNIVPEVHPSIQKSVETDVQPVFVKRNKVNPDKKEEFIDHLIAEFSKDAPKIIYSPEKHNGNANYGKDSLEEDPNIVSETLANIYADQGCYDEAIRMYKILQLHFPEKSCYFAARIENLEKNQSGLKNSI